MLILFHRGAGYPAPHPVFVLHFVLHFCDFIGILVPVQELFNILENAKPLVNTSNSRIYKGVLPMEQTGVEPIHNACIYNVFLHSCCISCCIFSKCFSIFLFCFVDSKSITFLYTVFMTLSLDHPPRCSIYWSGTPMACMMDAA